MTTVRASRSPEGSLPRSFSPCLAYAACSAVVVRILPHVYNLMRRSENNYA